MSLQQTRAISSAALTIAFLLACAGDRAQGIGSDDAQLSHDGLRTAVLKADWSVRSPAFGMLHRVTGVGRYLWIADISRDPYLHVIDTTSRQILHSVGRFGEGPGDFTSVGAVLPVRGSDSTVAVYDPMALRITVLSPTTLSDSKQSAPETYRFGPTGIATIRHFGPDRILAFTRYSGKGFRILSLSGAELASADHPHPGSDSISKHERIRAAGGASPCTRLDGKGFALTYRWAGRVALFDSLARPTSLADVPFASAERFVFDAKAREMKFEAERAYYFNCMYSADHLFALFSGKRLEGLQEGEDEVGDFLHVFTLDGKFLRAFKLDHPVSAFTIDSSGQRLFAVSWNDPGVFAYTVPSLRQ